MAVALITPTAYARHRGCDEKAVRKAIAANRISTIGGMVDAAVADIQWLQNTRARVKSAPTAVEVFDVLPAAAMGAEARAAGATWNPPPDSTSDTFGQGYANHRARRERAEAERAELETARLAGRVLDRERAERGTFDAFRSLRDAAFAAVKTQARRVVGLTEIREIELALEDDLREVYAGWEDQMRQRLNEAAS